VLFNEKKNLRKDEKRDLVFKEKVMNFTCI
jgi:hypothetical protein